MTEASSRRRKDLAKLVWDPKLKRAPNPKDIEFQTVEIVIPNPKQDQEPELRKAIKDNFGALTNYWAVDWDYGGQTFRSTWQAIRGNGKRAGTVPTLAESPELPSGKRTIAVRLVDVFGNDASATVEVKD